MYLHLDLIAKFVICLCSNSESAVYILYVPFTDQLPRENGSVNNTNLGGLSIAKFIEVHSIFNFIEVHSIF